MKVRVFSTAVCPKCLRLKKFFDAHGIAYDTMDMQSPEGMTELLSNNVFIWDAPVLQVGDKFYGPKELFKGADLQSNEIVDKVWPAQEFGKKCRWCDNVAPGTGKGEKWTCALTKKVVQEFSENCGEYELRSPR